MLLVSPVSKSRNSDRCRSSLRLCPKVASKIEVDVVVVFVSSVLREASAHFTWQQWSPGCPTKGAQICGHHFLAQQQMWQEEMLPPICIYVTYYIYKFSKHYLQIPTVSKILEEPLKHGITHLNFSIKSSLYAMLHVVVFLLRSSAGHRQNGQRSSSVTLGSESWLQVAPTYIPFGTIEAWWHDSFGTELVVKILI